MPELTSYAQRMSCLYPADVFGPSVELRFKPFLLVQTARSRGCFGLFFANPARHRENQFDAAPQIENNKRHAGTLCHASYLLGLQAIN